MKATSILTQEEANTFVLNAWLDSDPITKTFFENVTARDFAHLYNNEDACDADLLHLFTNALALVRESVEKARFDAQAFLISEQQPDGECVTDLGIDRQAVAEFMARCTETHIAAWRYDWQENAIEIDALKEAFTVYDAEGEAHLYEDWPPFLRDHPLLHSTVVFVYDFGGYESSDAAYLVLPSNLSALIESVREEAENWGREREYIV